MQKGFTLVELLIVIAILAVLAVTVVVVLNPAELLRQSRDSTRISDLAAVNSAISLYMTDVTSPGIGGADNATCTTLSRCTAATTTTPFNGQNITGNGCGVGTAIASLSIDGTGWVAVDLANITGGSPLARLPLDPINTANYPYAYACNGLNFELDTRLESTKYNGLMANDKDGGTNPNWYEVGNTVGL